MVGGVVSQSGVAPLVVVVGNIVAEFKARFLQAGEATAVKQFGFEPAPAGLGLGVVVAVAAPAHARLGAVGGARRLPKRVAVGWLPKVTPRRHFVRMHEEPSRPPHSQGPT